MMLKVNDLTVRLSAITVVKKLSLTLSPGELLVVLGPNGAGKSTVLKALAGELVPADGQVWLDGRLLSHWPARSLARLRAVMPQRVDVNFPLTVDEVICLGRPPEPAVRSRAVLDELAGLLDIGHLRRALVPNLSGGEQQRVQLARVLAQVWDTPGQVMLLLDECTSALDPAHQHQVFELLRELAEQRRFAVLAVAHDLNLAARFGHRLLLMREGECYCTGAPEQVLTSPALRAVYGLDARIMSLPEGYPLVVPLGRLPKGGEASQQVEPRYCAPENSSCRQAS